MIEYVEWRTRAEVDQKRLIDMLLSAEKQKAEATEVQSLQDPFKEKQAEQEDE